MEWSEAANTKVYYAIREGTLGKACFGEETWW